MFYSIWLDFEITLRFNKTVYLVTFQSLCMLEAKKKKKIWKARLAFSSAFIG